MDDANKSLDRSHGKRLSHQSPFGIASVYARLGQKDEAFAWLKKALESGLSRYAGRSVFEFDLLRSDPQYPELVRRIGVH
jgi:hypothetical protein